MTTPDPLAHLRAIANAHAALIRAEVDPLPAAQASRRGLVVQAARAELERCLDAARTAFPDLPKA